MGSETMTSESWHHPADWTLGIIVVIAAAQLGTRKITTVWPSWNTWNWVPALLGVGLAASYWAYLVNLFVPEPYLDEIFHIPQAQRYCLQKWREWDDKLTTPPGLYLFSIGIPAVLARFGWVDAPVCDAYSLRVRNAAALVFLGYFSLLCRHEQEIRRHPPPLRAHARQFGFSEYALHTAFNICLFPLLFFFSGLYYTDVPSTLSVLVAYWTHLRRVNAEPWAGKSIHGLAIVIVGLGALVMRQTNVFWVVVLLGGLEAVNAVKSLEPQPANIASNATLLETVKFYTWRASVGDVHDLPLSEARVEDWILSAISLLIAGLCNPLRFMRSVWPYLTVLVSFAGFVVCNGGVVLGDKSNHVATIHLPQMLYIWPFFVFFSFPLVIPRVIAAIDKAWAAMSGSPVFNASASTTSLVINTLYPPLATLLSFAVVRFNTIIHPFTLADNRHYMFYVFRYTIRRAGWVRYALVPAYSFSRWAVWSTLSAQPAPEDVNPRAQEFETTQDLVPSEEHKRVKAVPMDGLSTSTGIIFLLATTLSLVTAPLVEPRYFIIPWVIWRLLLPPPSLPPTGRQQGLVASLRRNPSLGMVWRAVGTCHGVLVLESLWFLAVNAITIWVFLAKPYQWRAEDGSVLDEGRLQRFMW